MQNAANSGLLCPSCRIPLVMSERQGVEIDYCQTCRGVWLDRGELDKIIERSTSDLDGTAPRQADRIGLSYGGHGGDGHRGGGHGVGKHRRRSFLSDLFD